MSLATNIANLATSVATAIKQTRTLINGNASDLSALSTTAKGNLVSAINEVAARAASATGINDATTASSSTWSSSKIDTEIDSAVGAIVIPNPADLINDTTPSSSKVYSSTKTNSAISTAIAGVPAPSTLIDDTTAGASKVYSSSKTNSAIAAVKNEILGGASAAFDTLGELQALIQSDQSGISSLTTAVGNRVRYDAAQSLTGPQQTQALSNIGAASAASLATLSANVGDTNTDFVATFTAGLT